MTKKHSFEFVYNYFKEQKCELLETEYINARTKMKYECKCKNESKITFDNFKNGVRCKICQNNLMKHTYKFVYNYFKQQDCELLETEYINNETKMKYRCKCDNQAEITFGHFQSGVRCMKCSGSEQLTYDFVYNYFKEQSCHLLETEYINNSIKMKYICECKNEAFITFNGFKTGHRCNLCKYKTQKKLFNWLKENFINYTIKNEMKFEWAKTEKSYLRYDFYITELNLIIELDGKQHFEQVSNWSSPEEQQINDNFKNKLANKNGYRMIRICQQIVLRDKENWDNQLKNAIENTSQLIKIGSIYNI